MLTFIVGLDIPDSVPATKVLDAVGSPVRFNDVARAWVRRDARDRDATWIVLQRQGEPLSIQQICLSVGNDLRAMEEALRRDGRFVRLNPGDRWAISECGIKASPLTTTLQAVIYVLREQ